MDKVKKQIKPFIQVNLLFLLFTFIFLFWTDQIFLNNKVINNLGNWTALILLVFYCFIFYKLHLGKWVIAFFIPFIPYLFYIFLLGSFWYYIFPDPFPNGEDNAAEGILVSFIAILHYLVICVAVLLNLAIKKWIKKTK